MGNHYDWIDDDGWDYYSYQKPRKVVGGLKTRKEHGRIGESWWSKRWLQVLEALGMGSRLMRGRSYARQGQVLSIDIQAGQVNARVQGSLRTPYTIEIQLSPLDDEQWEQVIALLASQALFAASLLAGEMPQDIEQAFAEAGHPLFPTTAADLRTSCSCPDWANPCKHIAAVYYILAEQFDADPFLIFALRGRSKEQIITSLRHKRAAALAGTQSEEETSVEAVQPTAASLKLEDRIATFWQAGSAIDTHIGLPQLPPVNKTLLKRLGDAPFNIKRQNLAELLGQTYDQIQRTTLEIIERQLTILSPPELAEGGEVKSEASSSPDD
ncbi:SWIM zinc finger family protein [Dictyobacter formicarum]|uniref:SWIM-type domain-containing protein n=1 Tax=Dictyobacter formicarum TaxID=2778368 RepID=A0ABQ3VU77_9CHLR|nr:SWIM zinc finger family protein [Dictyobacter formicarum]GHO89355.1 hypothetical protein KSZ_73610 [Dictyobacter formicarum]